MEVSAETLQTLHRIHRQLADLKSRLSRGPRQIQVAEQSVQHLEQALADAKQQVTKTKMAADQRELQLKEREGRISDRRIQLNSCSTNKQYQALLEQIAADEQANSVLSDEILEMLDKIATHQQRAQQAAQELEQGQAELARVRDRVEGERAGLESEVARVTQQLQAAEKRLPSDFRTHYLRIVKGRGAEALAPLDGNCCGSCYQTVTPQTTNELMLARPVFCKSCGCILYLPEETSPARRDEPSGPLPQ